MGGGGVHFGRDLFDSLNEEVRLKLDCVVCDLGSGCGVFGVNEEYEVNDRLMILLLLPLLDNFLLSFSCLVDVGVAIIELIMFVVGVEVVVSPFVFGDFSTFASVADVGENNSSSCFFADKNGS